MCRGAHDYRCWNALTVDGPLAAHKLIEAIRRAIESLPDFDPLLLQAVRHQRQQRSKDVEHQRQEYARRQADNQRQINNILEVIKQAGSSPSLLEELRRLEMRIAQIEDEKHEQHSFLHFWT